MHNTMIQCLPSFWSRSMPGQSIRALLNQQARSNRQACSCATHAACRYCPNTHGTHAFGMLTPDQLQSFETGCFCLHSLGIFQECYGRSTVQQVNHAAAHEESPSYQLAIQWTVDDLDPHQPFVPLCHAHVNQLSMHCRWRSCS